MDSTTATTSRTATRPKQWRVAKTGADASPEGILNDLLVARGLLTEEARREFLSPEFPRDAHDPFLFQDMRAVVERIFGGIERHEKMALFGDYDADGVCSSVLLSSVLQALGAEVVDVYLPHREKEGYGLNLNAITSFAEAGVTLVMTLDCGTTNTAEIAAAKERDMDVIVIDHHHVPETRPDCFGLLNPKMPTETYPFKFLASVGMAFKVAQALLAARIETHPEEADRWRAFEKWLLDLVAIATVTDMVPLVGENRTLLTFGLKVLNKTQRVGLKALIEAMGGELGSLDTTSIGFQIGPRLNAAGRMQHANAAYELLMCEDADRAATLALALNAENQMRQQRTEEITAQARVLLEGHEDDRILVVAGDGWPSGLVGLVASRIMEQFHRPVLIIGRTEHGLTGSGRSIPSFNIIEALHTMPELFTKFGGHAQACGFTVRDEAGIETLRQRLNDLARQQLHDDDLLPVVTADAALRLRDVQWTFFDAVQRLEPFGMNNPKPKFLIGGVRVVGLTAVGAAGQHLRLTLSDEQGTIRQAIGFRMGSRLEEMRLGDAVDCIAELMLNEWNGNREIQLKLVDFRLSVG